MPVRVDGVLLEEGHTTRNFQLCTSLLDEEADTFVSPILQVISSAPPCKLIEETCEKKFSMHFDYCTTASIDFVLLDEATFSKILRHPDLTPFLERSDLSRKIPTFDFLVKEAICYLEFGLANPQGDHKVQDSNTGDLVLRSGNTYVMVTAMESVLHWHVIWGTSMGKSCTRKEFVFVLAVPFQDIPTRRFWSQGLTREQPLPGLGLKMERIARGGLLTLAKTTRW
ncbi:unnamed protein product [Camellia sinensis]